jgi:hypothetical protein
MRELVAKIFVRSDKLRHISLIYIGIMVVMSLMLEQVLLERGKYQN